MRQQPWSNGRDPMIHHFLVEIFHIIHAQFATAGKSIAVVVLLCCCSVLIGHLVCKLVSLHVHCTVQPVVTFVHIFHMADIDILYYNSFIGTTYCFVTMENVELFI
jgi:hypothetical protein